jgi:hypothetical protein
VLRNHGAPVAIAVAYTHTDDRSDARLTLVDLRAPLDRQTPSELSLPRPARVMASDVNGDGMDDLLLSDSVGTRVFRLDGGTATMRLRPTEW